MNQPRPRDPWTPRRRELRRMLAGAMVDLAIDDREAF
jgi:hypothetical protein